MEFKEDDIVIVLRDSSPWIGAIGRISTADTRYCIVEILSQNPTLPRNYTRKQIGFVRQSLSKIELSLLERIIYGI